MQTETDVIFGRIVRAWRQYTGQTLNLNLNIGFKKGGDEKPDVSCTIILYNYFNRFSGTMTHENGHELDPPVTGQWWAIRDSALNVTDPEAPQYVVGWGDTIAEAMLDAERKMHERFSPPKDTP